MQRYIDYLDQLDAGTTRNILNIVTTADVTSIDNIRDYAAEKNVAVHHLVAHYRKNKNGGYELRVMERVKFLGLFVYDRQPTFISNVIGQKQVKF